jgi:hypothetical protein
MSRRVTSRCLALGVATAGLALVGCGGSGGGSSTAGTASSARPGPQQTPAARFVLGRWHGELHQRGIPPFRIAVTVRSLSSATANRVHYTGINCGGHWAYSGTSGVTVSFREVIDIGKGGKCKGVGEVTLRREEARLRYRFSGGGVVSRGLLSRD